MREVNVDKVTENIKEMCIEANHFLTDDMKKVFKKCGCIGGVAIRKAGIKPVK